MFIQIQWYYNKSLLVLLIGIESTMAVMSSIMFAALSVKVRIWAKVNKPIVSNASECVRGRSKHSNNVKNKNNFWRQKRQKN